MQKSKLRFDSARFEEAVFQVADRFLSSPDTPEVGIHFSRLQREGHSIETAKRMIGTTIVTHIYLSEKKKTAIDWSLVKSELARLPKIGVAPDGRTLDIRGIEYTK